MAHISESDEQVLYSLISLIATLAKLHETPFSNSSRGNHYQAKPSSTVQLSRQCILGSNAMLRKPSKLATLHDSFM